MANIKLKVLRPCFHEGKTLKAGSILTMGESDPNTLNLLASGRVEVTKEEEKKGAAGAAAAS